MRTSDSLILDNSTKKDLSVKRPHKEKRKRLFYILLFLFVLGLMYGALLLTNGEKSFVSQLSLIQQQTLVGKESRTFFSNLMVSLCSSSVFLLLTFLFGFSAIGQPLTAILMLIKGLGIGSSIGYFYLNYGMAGIGYSALFILPCTVVSMLALMISARESIRLSNLLLHSFFKKDSASKQTLKLYILKHLILTAFLFFAALLDALVYLLFGGLFPFI